MDRLESLFNNCLNLFLLMENDSNECDEPIMSYPTGPKIFPQMKGIINGISYAMNSFTARFGRIVTGLRHMLTIGPQSKGVFVLNNLISVTRANFLPLTVVIVMANVSAAFYSHRAFSIVSAIMVLIGALLLHASVNAFNNYFDYKSMIDSRTVKTPFSGGVDILVKGEMKGSSALLVAVICLAVAGAIGTYFLMLFFTLSCLWFLRNNCDRSLYTDFFENSWFKRDHCGVRFRSHGARSLRDTDGQSGPCWLNCLRSCHNTRWFAVVSERISGR